jgi:hypothetical protein
LIKWDWVVVDEAHRMKNRQSLLAENVGSLNRSGILLLTGTPGRSRVTFVLLFLDLILFVVHNNLEELNSLLNLTNPHLFPRDPRHLLNLFGDLLEKDMRDSAKAELLDQLHALLKVVESFKHSNYLQWLAFYLASRKGCRAQDVAGQARICLLRGHFRIAKEFIQGHFGMQLLDRLKHCSYY